MAEYIPIQQMASVQHKARYMTIDLMRRYKAITGLMFQRERSGIATVCLNPSN
ncbi:MAG: hypothetical protein GX422_01195 [Deltaproteobacteria bacterium]|jgi:hypothetical protein|nr:hypothetical protein [Deltaproteobacteria bacterium]